MNRSSRDNWIRWAAALAIGYLVIASVADRFRHPDLSETQLFLRLPKAVLWQD